MGMGDEGIHIVTRRPDDLQGAMDEWSRGRGMVFVGDFDESAGGGAILSPQRGSPENRRMACRLEKELGLRRPRC